MVYPLEGEIDDVVLLDDDTLEVWIINADCDTESIFYLTEEELESILAKSLYMRFHDDWIGCPVMFDQQSFWVEGDM